MHTSPDNKVYIGVSTNCIKRWKNGKGYKKNKHFFSAIEKYGWDNFKHEILYSDLTQEDAGKKEIELIGLYDSTNRKNGYNHATGGLLNHGYKLSVETRKKMSESHIGKNVGKTHPNYGKPISDEQKLKISINRKGKYSGKDHYLYGKHRSDSVKQKISQANSGRHVNVGQDNYWYGKNFSDEHKSKISDSLKGRKLSEEHINKLIKSKEKTYKKVVQKDLNGNILKHFNSIGEASRCTGVKKGTISYVANHNSIGKRYIFEFEKEGV